MDQDQVARLLETNLDGLRAFLRVRAGAALRAKLGHSDLVQTVCREVLENAETIEFRSDAAFRGWLYTAALRKLIEKQRHFGAEKRNMGREFAVDAEGAEQQAALQGYAAAVTPSVMAMGREGARKLEEAFDALDEEQREIITLARFAGLSHAEIAALQNKTEEACRQALRRALIRLSAELSARGIEI